MPTPEGKVKSKVKKLLGTYKHLYSFMPVPVMYQASSLDYLICYTGVFIAIETKAPTGQLTPRQRLTIRGIEAAGGTVFVIHDDEGLLALKAYLDNLY
jgi:hypothetical protein